MKRLLPAVFVALLVTSAFAPSAAQATLAPFGNACTAFHTVRFCPATELNQRPTSFDGTPIDADVTLPATGTGPWPTVIMIHGWGQDKTAAESSADPTAYAMNNVSYAARGYAVLNISNRGFGRSCGKDPLTVTTGCEHGYIHLMDTRFEAHDAQYLLGKLVDDGIVNPNAIGATGGSYGGIATLELSYLKNRVRNLDGSYSAWTSPINHTPITIKAGYAVAPWSNFAGALIPNGRYLDFDSATASTNTTPFGVPKASPLSGLYQAGLFYGRYAAAGLDPFADVINWNKRTIKGEPWDAEALSYMNIMNDYHSPTTVSGTPAALLIHNGWTDDIFGPAEGLRVYESQKAKGNNNVRLIFNDSGHPRSQNPTDALTQMGRASTEFFDNQLKGVPGGPAAGSVTAMGMNCDGTHVSGGPWTASSWEKLHVGAVDYSTTKAQTIYRLPGKVGGDKATGTALDPVFGTAGACGQLTDMIEPYTATYSITSKGFTMLGLPTVQATVKTAGKYGVIAARLWEVIGGKRRLITRGVYRLLDNQSGTITFQLAGNAYKFAAGTKIRLELLPQDAPYYQTSKGTFTVKISKLKLELPTLEVKSASKGIVTPTISKFKR